MATNQNIDTSQQIAEQRKQFEEAKKSYQLPTEKRIPFTPRKVREEIRAGTERIGQAETEFESQLGQYYQQYAKPEFVQQYREKITSEVNQKIQELQNKLNDYKQRYEERLARYKEKLDKEKDSERRAKIKENIKELENDYEKDTDRVNYEIRGLQDGLRRGIDKGISFSQVLSYSRDYRRYEEAKDKQREQARLALEQIKLENPDFKIDYNNPLGQLEKLQKSKQTVTVGITEAALKAMNLTAAEYTAKVGANVRVVPSTGGWQQMTGTAYYDPLSKEFLFQSIDPKVAAQKGYQKVDVTAFNPQTGEYQIKSQTGLLTPEQQKFYDFTKTSPREAQFLAGRDLMSAPVPTEFIVGGPGTKQKELTSSERLASFQKLIGTSALTTYEASQARAAFTPKELDLIEYYRNPKEFYNKKGYAYSPEGQRLEGGGVTPITASDVLTVLSLPKAVATFGAAKTATFLGSELITKPLDVAYEKTYQPKSFLGQFGKAAVFSALTLRSPTLSTAYLSTFAKSFATKPKETAAALKEQAITRPGELSGFLIGGALLKRGINIAEAKIRGVPTKTVNLPQYGEVVIQKIPKYGEVVWIKGKFSQSEKVNIMKQIEKLEGKKTRIFTQVSSQGIPMKSFTNTKNLGFEVKQLENPMRGYYEAPPFTFLKEFNPYIKTTAGSLSYYAQLGGRDRILPSPIGAVRSLLQKGMPTTQRPFQYLRRTYKEVKTPSWIKEVAKSMDSNKPIPIKYSKTINKYYKQFLDTPLEFQGKIYVGLEKAKLLNAFNLKYRANPTKLKVYLALIEYQNTKKITLAGGAELLSGVKPYGPESQIVSAIGTRYYAKSKLDLRKGVKPSVSGKLLEWVTGTKRGQYVARVDGQMVEIQPVRQFLKKGTKQKRGKIVSAKVTTDVIREVERLRERRITQVTRPSRPIRVETRTRAETRIERAPTRLIAIRERLDIRKPEIRRVEKRKEEQRPINRFRESIRPEIIRPELRRTDLRREPLQTPIRPREPTRPREPFISKTPIVIKRKEDKQKKVVKQKAKVKGRKYKLLPTIANVTLKKRRPVKIDLSRVTGFEVLR